MEAFQTEDQCHAYLVKSKWGKGFSCRRCQHTVSVKGRIWHHRRCKACGYDESSTAHTLFHKLKFPLPVAFTIVYQLTTMKKGMSTLEISRQHGIHQETAWFFKRKIQQAMSAYDTDPLAGLVEADETVIGGFEPGAVGRSKGKRKIVEIAVELGPEVSKLGRARIFRAKAKHIADYSAEEISKAMDKMIDPNAVVVTDEWRSYRKALGTRIHLPIPSEKGDAMPEIHRLIFNLKNWLRGTHHKVSDFHLEQYLNEFFCRFNFRNCLESLPFKILNQMVRHDWKPYKQVIAT
ncbi:MAG: IS1595 family transposase [Flavobacteriales bacterium]